LPLIVACNVSDIETGNNRQAEADTGTEAEDDTGTDIDEDTDTNEELTLSSTAFGEGEDIPVRYSCDGEDKSPQLTWNNAPAGTQSFVLIMDDPDAPGDVFTHWVLFNLPADARQLPEAVPAEEELDNGARHGINGFGNTHYGGPCPPPGPAHRYQFTL
jgi:Raf kinase inhibitor-like YbhB/YbcL family protein